MAGFKIKVYMLCVVIFFGSVSAIVNIDPEKKENIDNFVNNLLLGCNRHSNIVGLNLAVVYEGEILYTTGYGVRNLGKCSMKLQLQVLK